MLKYIFAIFLCFILLILAIGYTLSIPKYNGIVANNFRNGVFHNLQKTQKKSFFDLSKWLISRNPPIWPNIKTTNRPDFSKYNGIKVTPIIHSTLLIQFENMNILTDPIWSKRASPFSFAGPKRVYEPPVKLSELPKIDMVLLSHNHYDHMDVYTLKELEKRFSPKFVTGLGNKKFLKSIGLNDVQELNWWESINDKITFVPAQHFSGRGLFDRNRSLWGGFIIKDNNKIVYFAGDTGYGDFFKEIYNRFGKISLALLPIGAYKPRSFMKSMHIDPKEAVIAMQDLHANRAIGIHFDSFARLADEEYNSAKNDLKKSLNNLGIDVGKFKAGEPGKTYVFDE